MAAPGGPPPVETRLRAPPSWRHGGRVLLVSCYELGRQSFSIASAWAQLEVAGFGVDGADISVDPLGDEALDQARLVAISVPMLTALRLGVEVATRVRERAPTAHICMFGMYAALNAERLLATVVDSVVGGEHEMALVALAGQLAGVAPNDAAEIAGVIVRPEQLERAGDAAVAPAVLRKLPFVVPQRDRLPPLHRYATLIGPGPGQRRLAGYVEASRGCLHDCRHCPVVPVYRRRLFVVPREVVLADAAQQIAAGAEHLSFGDPDFFNGPRHVMAIARELHASFPELSFDVTTKVGNILAHRAHVAELASLGCAFIISAVESLSDSVLRELDKGHCRRDIDEALAICRAAGVALRPSLMPFTPWSTLEDYLALLEWVLDEQLVRHLDPVQLTIRLLLPPGSALLWHTADRPWLGALDARGLGYTWRHSDPRMDALHAEVSTLAASAITDDAGAVVLRIREQAYHAAGLTAPTRPAPTPCFVPRMSEAWFCCAEPHCGQQPLIADAPSGTP